MPNRIIKESICTSETIDQMSWFEECFFHRLLVNCDDYGCMDARPKILKSKLFPLKDRLSLKDIESALHRLADIGCVRLYECDSKPYLYLPTWESHQTVRAKRRKYPSPNDVKSDEIICKQLQSDACNCARNPIQSESLSESNPRECAKAPRSKFVKPTVDEVRKYCKERKNTVNPEAFCNFYESKGWKIGKDSMRDWKAAVRTWENREPHSESYAAYDLGEFEDQSMKDLEGYG